MATFSPAEFGERLRRAMEGPEALRARGQPWDIKALREAVAKRTGGTRGTSYAQFWSYVRGKPPAGGLRSDILQAIADELGVLPDWLAYGPPHPPTERERAAREVERQAAQEQRSDWRVNMRYVQDAFGDGGERLADDGPVTLVVLSTLRRLLVHGPYPEPREYRDADDSNKAKKPKNPDYPGLAAALAGKQVPLRREPWNEPRDLLIQNVGRYLGHQLRAPFNGLRGLSPADLDDETFLDYVTATCQALGRLSDAHRRRPNTPATDPDTKTGD